MTVELRTWRWEPCPSVTGVKHDGCDYLGHIICDKCGWVEPDHRCVAHYGTLTPDTRLQAIADPYAHFVEVSEQGTAHTPEAREAFDAVLDVLDALLVDALTEDNDG